MEEQMLSIKMLCRINNFFITKSVRINALLSDDMPDINKGGNQGGDYE